MYSNVFRENVTIASDLVRYFRGAKGDNPEPMASDIGSGNKAISSDWPFAELSKEDL